MERTTYPAATAKPSGRTRATIIWCDLRQELDRIREYIEQNPVNAGLVVDDREYPWSSATSRLKGGCGQDWPPHIL